MQARSATFLFLATVESQMHISQKSNSPSSLCTIRDLTEFLGPNQLTNAVTAEGAKSQIGFLHKGAKSFAMCNKICKRLRKEIYLM
jgi:hypothetical protein